MLRRSQPAGRWWLSLVRAGGDALATVPELAALNGAGLAEAIGAAEVRRMR